MRVGIVGATGYTGSELVRWLLGHPSVEIAAVVSTSQPGRPLADVVPALAGFTDLVLQPFDPVALGTLDAVLLATPHGAARDLVPLLDGPIVLDSSSDHRHVPGWTYGLVEYAAEEIASSTRIAVPGCFATALCLSIAPLAPALTGPVSIAAATGSTGSGATPSSTTHHPERAVNLRAYKVLGHQHAPEVAAFLSRFGPPPKIRFVPWSAPIDRGIFATTFAPVPSSFDARAAFADAYGSRALIRLRAETPEVRHVRGTALCDLAVHQDDDGAVVLCAIDNLGKGAAAQAVQCLNLVAGLPVDTGLVVAPPTP